MTINDFSERSGFHASQVSRLENGQRLPDAMTLVRLAKALRVTVDWILTGEDGEMGAVPPAPPPPRGLELTLPGFLQAVESRGLARWASEALKSTVPTVEEALRAIDTLQRSPARANEKGEPLEGWEVFILAERKGAKAGMPPPEKLYAHLARASERTAIAALAVLFKAAERLDSNCEEELKELRESATADGLGKALIGALSGPHALVLASNLAIALRTPERMNRAFERVGHRPRGA